MHSNILVYPCEFRPSLCLSFFLNMLIHVSVQVVITSARLLDRMCLRPQADSGSSAGPFIPRVLLHMAIKSSITRERPESQSFHFTASLRLPSGRVDCSWRRRFPPRQMTRRGSGNFASRLSLVRLVRRLLYGEGIRCIVLSPLPSLPYFLSSFLIHSSSELPSFLLALFPPPSITMSHSHSQLFTLHQHDHKI